MFTSILSRRIPALFTTTWRSPKVSIASCTSRAAASKSEQLSVCATASPPMATISSTTCCAGARSAPTPWLSPPRSFTTTLAPSAANSRACSRPRPRPAPVMIATRPSSAPICRAPSHHERTRAPSAPGTNARGESLAFSRCDSGSVVQRGRVLLPGAVDQERVEQPHGSRESALHVGAVILVERGEDHPEGDGSLLGGDLGDRVFTDGVPLVLGQGHRGERDDFA